MKKYIPYIVILLLTYLVTAFIYMQFNPAHWTINNRIGMICFTGCIMLIYPIAKLVKEDFRKSIN